MNAVSSITSIIFLAVLGLLFWQLRKDSKSTDRPTTPMPPAEALQKCTVRDYMSAIFMPGSEGFTWTEDGWQLGHHCAGSVVAPSSLLLECLRWNRADGKWESQLRSFSGDDIVYHQPNELPGSLFMMQQGRQMP